jgi:3-hydroxybutyryl-CoA dehydrogenase
MDQEKVKRVVVVGAGTMGHSIAQVFAQAGIEVNLVGRDEKRLERAIKLVESNLQTLAEYGCFSGAEMPAVLGRIHPFVDLAAAAQETDFAVETVPEVPEVKKNVFSQLDQFCPDGTIIASNTSGLDVFSIAEIKEPKRLVIAHWFAPAHIIPLVEVVPGPDTSAEVVSFTAGLMERIGKKTSIMQRFVPSFIVNRIQGAIARTVSEILTNNWASPEEIDRAVKLSLGIRLPVLGVVQSLDFNGLDLLHSLHKRNGVHFPLIEEKVRQGHLGVKTSKGIYDYQDRSETEILHKRDMLLLAVLDHLEKLKAFDPV